jgi:hypothetical protein
MTRSDCTVADQNDGSPDEKATSPFWTNKPSRLTTIDSISGQLPFQFTALYSTRECPCHPVAVIQHVCGSSCGSCSATSSIFVTRISPSGIALRRFHANKDAAKTNTVIVTFFIDHPVWLEEANASVQRTLARFFSRSCFFLWNFLQEVAAKSSRIVHVRHYSSLQTMNKVFC